MRKRLVRIAKQNLIPSSDLDRDFLFRNLFCILVAMKTAYIFHDAFNDQFSDWYPWMKTKLESMGYMVLVPAFPTPAGQSYESWRAVIKNYVPTFDEETIIIGHGSGGLFALRILEEITKQIHGLFLVAAYAKKIGHAGYDRVNESMIHEFNFDTIKSHAMIVHVYAGDDDPFVPRAVSDELATQLNVPLEIIPGGGHINRGSGFNQLVVVAGAIKESGATLAKSLDTEPGMDTTVGLDLVPTQPEPDSVVFNQPQSVPVTPVMTQSIPVPVKQNPVVVPQKKLVGLETMYQDMSHLVNSNSGTVASSLLNEARVQEQELKNISPTSSKNMMYILGTIIVILVGLGIFGLVIKNNASVAPIASTNAPVPSLISADTHTTISSTGEAYTLATAIRSALAKPGSDGTILDIDYANNSIRPSFANVLKALGITTLPDSLAGVLPQSAGSKPVFMHGQAYLGPKQAPFLVIPITDYDTAFSGFRSWESTLFRDTGVMMNVPQDFLKQYLSSNSFDDELIDNHQVRVLRYKSPANDESGTPLVISPYTDGDVMIAYFFLNDHAVVVVNNLDVIPTILQRYDDRQVYTQK